MPRALHLPRPIILSALVLLLLTQQVRPQQHTVLRPSSWLGEPQGVRLHEHRDLTRPKIGLVLSGGGGRGLAQIGVLRALERHHIPIDLIIGNSLGSVVGGLYASGYSVSQIESIAVHTNWSDLLSFAEETKRTDLFVGQKRVQQEGYLLIRFEGLEPIIPSSISGGQRLSNFFSYLTLQALYHPNPTFDELKTPFRATATDLISGRRIIIDRGSVAEAMRASVTVPLLYSPVEKDSMALVDGGLASNIPADVARSLGCEVVIVVNSTSSMRNAAQLNAPWEIADQIMTIMMQESNRQQLKLADVVITPEGENRIVSDFSGIDTLIAAGDRAGEQGVPEILNALERHAGTTPQTAFIEPRVTFEGGSFPETTRTEILRTATEGALSTGRIQMILDELYASGKYADLSATITATGSPAEIMFSATPARSIERVEFNGNRLVASSQIEREIAPLKGGDGDAKLIGQSVERVLALYREDGYSLARVESLAVDRQNGTIRFHVDEGRIAQIRYEGNEKTRDYIIRREFPMDEGDVFSIAKASQGVVNIKSTGLFDYVLLDVRYVDNRPVVIIKVKEKSSELLRLGFHADDEHGVVSTIDLRDGNFRGAWEDLGVVLRYGYRDRGVRAEYTVNRIFHTYLTFNLGLYFKSRDIITYRDSPSEVNEHWDRIEDGRYRQINSGGTMTFGSNFKRLGDITAEIRWENDKIEGISGGGYTPELYRYVGLKFQSTIDTEDKFLFPTEGMALTMSYESALRNLGSDVGFGKIGVSYESYYSIFPRHTLRPRITFGFADQTLPIAEQYSLGGLNSFFGLREDDSRGRQVFLVNLEYRYEPPFRLIFDTYLKLRYDLGTISLVPEELKFNSFRHAVGVELALATPLGQVSFGMGKSFYSRRDLPNSPVTVGPLLLYFSVGPGL